MKRSMCWMSGSSAWSGVSGGRLCDLSVLLLGAWREGTCGLVLPARPVSVCWLLLVERAKSVLRGSAMCDVEGGGAAAAEEAPPWGASGCGFVAHGVECVRVLSPVASAPLRWGLPLLLFFVVFRVPGVLVGAFGFHFIVSTEVMSFGLGDALCLGFVGGRLEPAVEMSVSGFQRSCPAVHCSIAIFFSRSFFSFVSMFLVLCFSHSAFYFLRPLSILRRARI